PRLAAALGLPDLPELPRRRVPSARAFRLALVGGTAAWWLLYPGVVLAPGGALLLAYGLSIWGLLLLLVGEWYAILWVAGAFDYLGRVRVPQVRHLVVRLVLREADPPAGGGAPPRQVWEDLAALVAGQAGVPVQEIDPERRFDELPDYC